MLRSTSAPVIGKRLATQPETVAHPIHSAFPVGGQVIDWGWLPILSVLNAGGVLLIAFGNLGSLSSVPWAEWLFWVGLLIMVTPIGVRVAAQRVARPERIGLLVWLGCTLYLVKVMHSPFAFTYSDELLHLFNLNEILRKGELFSFNPILPVSALYPGLEIIAAAFASLSGLPTYLAGLVVIGVGRLVMVLALFLFTEQVTRSTRVAGVATLLYMTHSNFLFWGVQFSYESISLPLATAVLFVATRREQAANNQSFIGLTLLTMIMVIGVIVTHHLTSYFLALFLTMWWLVDRFGLEQWVMALVTKLLGWGMRIVGQPQWSSLSIGPVGAHVNETAVDPVLRHAWGPRGLAWFALVAALAWLLFVASSTLTYLSPVLNRAVLSVLSMIAGEESGRELFHSTSGYVAPFWERATGISSVLLSLLSLPWGLWQVWRRRCDHPLLLLLACAAVAYFGMLGFRLTDAGWETANRASAYLYLGLAITLALGFVEFWTPLQTIRRRHFVFALYFAILFMGGVIAGWSPQIRLTQPYLVDIGEQTIETQGRAAAQWMHKQFGPYNLIAAEEAMGGDMLAYGHQYGFSGRHPDTNSLLRTPELTKSQLDTLRKRGIYFVLVDRRKIGRDNMAGHYFDRTGGGPVTAEQLLPPELYQKFEGLERIDRIFDSGSMVIYDLEALVNELSTP